MNNSNNRIGITCNYSFTIGIKKPIKIKTGAKRETQSDSFENQLRGRVIPPNARPDAVRCGNPLSGQGDEWFHALNTFITDSGVSGVSRA